MGYIAVDIPHFILVLFSLFVCSIQYRQSMNRTSSYVIRKVHILTRIVSQMACVRERNLTPAPVYNTQGERPNVPRCVAYVSGELVNVFKSYI